MDVSKLDQRLVAGILVLLLGASTFLGFVIKDHLHKNKEREVQVQMDEKEKKIKETEAKAVTAEQKAATAEGAKKVAEDRYQKALERIKGLEKKPLPVPTTVATTTNISMEDPCEPIREMLGAEHEARVACGEALGYANEEIDHLKDANRELHTLSDQKDEKFDLQSEKLKLVIEDRDTQEHRKKLWRGTAVGAIITTLLLLL